MSKQFINNLYETLESAKLDPIVGIRLVHLSGGLRFSLFGAEIAPHKKVGAHFHKSGVEIYQIVAGDGLMYLGKPDYNGRVDWDLPFKLIKGDCFTIEEGIAHQLINISDEKMIAVFGCPESHISMDRILVEGINDGQGE